MSEELRTEEKQEWVKLRPSSIIMPLLCIILLLAVCPVLSYSSDEVHCLAGGLEESPLIHSNFFGKLGSAIAWRFLLTFGVAGYPLIILMLLSSLRRALWRRNLKAISWEYISSFLLFGVGMAMFFGIWPDAFKGFTAELNISTLPGGVIGQRLSSPAGFLTLFLNDTGAAILSLALVALPVAIIWYFDWQDIFKSLATSQAKKTEEPAPAPKEPEETPFQANEPPHEPKVIQAAPPQPQPAPSDSSQLHVPVSPRSLEKYEYPSINLLDDRSAAERSSVNAREIERNAKLLQKTLDDFGVQAQVVSQVVAPQITQFEIMPESGVRLNMITGLESNIKMALSAQTLRILAPIPGKNLVGIQVPNETRAVVSVRSLMQDENWKNGKAQIPLLLGKNINGKNVILDLAKAPHLLIAGTTGSGKSVCMNLLITSMLYKFNPEELRLIMVDPKVVEFQAYTTLPHLVVPVINEVEKVPLALKWAINEMERRYRVLAKANVRNLADFNSRPKSKETILDDEGNPIPDKLPFIVIIIDELADIMAVAKKDVETNLSRIAAKSRAVGIHTIIATQRPDTKVITGTIKANYPVRIAFRVASHIDSQTILNTKGAESLLGYGDMLYNPPGASTIDRIQCGMASDEERNKVVAFCAAQAPQHFDETVFVSPDENGTDADVSTDGDSVSDGSTDNSEEKLIKRAIDVILTSRRPTISYLQRALGIGYNKAATLMDELEARGIVGPQLSPSSTRQILVTSSGKSNSGEDNQDI